MKIRNITFGLFAILLLVLVSIPNLKVNAQTKPTEEETLAKYVKEKEPKAIKTSSGLYYVIITPGTGEMPKPGQTVTAHYKGTFMDGKVFDEDKGRGFPFPLGQHHVIAGWDEGFALLKKGTKAKLIIPSKLAYGEMGYSSLIAPNTPLIFEVELADIK